MALDPEIDLSLCGEAQRLHFVQAAGDKMIMWSKKKKKSPKWDVIEAWVALTKSFESLNYNDSTEFLLSFFLTYFCGSWNFQEHSPQQWKAKEISQTPITPTICDASSVLCISANTQGPHFVQRGCECGQKNKHRRWYAHGCWRMLQKWAWVFCIRSLMVISLEDYPFWEQWFPDVIAGAHFHVSEREPAFPGTRTH